MIEPPGRTYSVDEANRALLEVDPLVARIARLSHEVPELQEAVQIANYRSSRPDAGPDVEAAREAARLAQHEAESELTTAVARLEILGVALKDPQVGLIDFYSVRDGEVVELCWKLGEGAIAHWHRIGEGFAGRKPL